MSAPASEPKYKITLIIERTDEPGARLKAVFDEIPKAAAESPGYIHYSAVETFRRYVISETRPDQREG